MPDTAVQPLTAGAGGIPWDITAGFTCADRAEGVRGRPPTRGRQLELRAIARQLGLLCEGQGGCLLIDGPPGMGKTRLLAELVQLARRRHLVVASATCDELDRHVPMLPLLTALRAGPDPVLSSSDLDCATTDPDRRFWFLERLRDILEQRSRRTPLVITLDDLQWADASTLIALRVLCLQLDTSAVLWAFSHHPGQASPDLYRVLDRLLAHDARRLSLTALDQYEALELATDLLGRTPSGTDRALIDGARGNPLLITELLRSAMEENAPGEPGAADIAGAGVPERFARHVRRRLRGLSPQVRQLLEVGAVLGRSFMLDDAARLLAVPAGLLIETLATALDTGLIVAEQDRLVFQHDLVHRAIYDDLPGALRTGLHREAGRLPGPDDARRPRPLAPELPGLSAVSAMTLTSQIAYYRGRVADALTTAQTAVRILPDEPAARDRLPRLWLTRVLLAGDQPATADGVCREGERLAIEIDAVWSRPYWHVSRARCHFECGRLTDAARDAETGHAIAEELGLARPAAAALGVLGRVAFHQGDLAGAENHARAAELAADGLTPDPGARWVKVLLADALGRPGHALDIAFEDDADADQERLAMLLEISVTTIPYMARMALRAGRTDDCRGLVTRARRLAESNPGLVTTTGIAAHVEGIARRDPEALARAAEAYQETGRRLAAAMAGEDLGRALLHAGDRAEAVAHLRRALTTVAEIGALRHADRIRRVLREAGVCHRFTSPRRPVTFGWGSLTDAEMRVATLAVEGLTNQGIADRLFLSPHTINTHLRHVYGKLGVNSRVGLVRVLLAETPRAAGH